MGWRFSGLPFDFRTFVQAPPGRPEIPRLAAVLGASYGDSALHAAMGHYVVMTTSAPSRCPGRRWWRRRSARSSPHDELGGPTVAAGTSGSAHAVVEDEAAALDGPAALPPYMPDTAAHPAPSAAAAAPGRRPRAAAHAGAKADPRRGYDMRKVLDAIVDDGSLLQWGERYGTSVLCALARIEGEAVGVVASQPMQRGAA